MTPAHLTRIVTATLAIVAAVALAGCGLTDPNQAALHNVSTTPRASAHASTTVAAADSHDPPGERGGTIPKRAQAAQDTLTPGAGRATATAALQRYAALYMNWTADTIVAHQRELADTSLGQARAQALQAVATASGDHLLAADHVVNSGHLVSIAPGQGGAAGQWVLVSTEHTTGQGDYAGLPPALHVIDAQLGRTSKGWVVTRWQSQS
jgi:hypothetical protein